MRQLCLDYGIIPASVYASRDEFINLLQIYDARRGILPVVNPREFFQWHGLSQHDLQIIAHKHGWKGGQLTKFELIEYLMENATPAKQLPEKDTLAIVNLLADDIEKSLRSATDRRTLCNAVQSTNRYHETWNHSLIATANAMRHLQTAIGQGLQPAPTSNIG